ncbi:Ecm19p [Saccharomyces cerevisiae YJM1273]|nr:Ecm19p [Saccharomyces cerevisiae YJM1273]AJV57200.1 Ecm19p [Saccharomyces cerevisiae YJM1381]AJV64366.1 Ecm19p [Saccharomyces cerevisiae YJM1434]CAD6637718.1 BJ4_G0032770.mRNA.1.CDS.1 [Saccharomyces cerevisiae]CAI4642361.1 AVI_1a_G0038260.mRNA.1.CDS.1 [Saccharomyces cerevisiae]
MDWLKNTTIVVLFSHSTDKSNKHKKRQVQCNMRKNTLDMVTIGIACLVGVYTGTRFFEPIVIDRLRKDGNLRTDIPIPEYDEDGNLLKVTPSLSSTPAAPPTPPTPPTSPQQ